MAGGENDTKHSDGDFLCTPVGDDLGRAKDGADVVRANDAPVILPAGADAAPPATITDQSFDHRVEKITSSILIVLCFVLNWWSAYSGHPQYVPDWVIGGCGFGFAIEPYMRIKNKVLRR